MRIDEILFRRKQKVILPEYTGRICTDKDKARIITILKNIESYGFTFKKDVFDRLCAYDSETCEMFYFDLIKNIKSFVGADVEYNPMYPNFPKQVIEMDDFELFFNAIIHYWTFGELMPHYEKDERFPLMDDVKLKVITIGTLDDVYEIFENLLSSKTSISDQDKEDIETIIKETSDWRKHLPKEIPLKENVAFLGKLVMDYSGNPKIIEQYYKTATDVLRLITAISGGDVSLATKTKYKSLRRKDRRFMMDLLSKCGEITEDMFRYKNEWIRVGEIIHPFEYKNSRYSKINTAFNTLRNEKKPEFFGAKVHKALNRHDTKGAAKLLEKRPGDFARQLDKLLRDSNKEVRKYILECFEKVAKNVSVPVLLQVQQHFKDRNNDLPIRVFFPKGKLAKAISINNELPHIDSRVCEKIVTICYDAIMEQFKSKERMGKVFIDEELKNYIVPFSQRSASKAAKQLVRGSRVGIAENAEAIRAFIWWTNTETSRVDIDLSAAFYDKDWNFIQGVSYTNLRSNTYRTYHSGDITNGKDVHGKGVAEFIDIDIESVANHARYVCFQVYSYTQQRFSNLPNCRFGWMNREKVNSGEIFEPSTVEMKIDLTCDGTCAIPVIFDCERREFVWCDMAMRLPYNSAISRYWGNNLENNIQGVTATCYAMTHLSKPNLYDLIWMNAIARGGEIVSDRNRADIIFSNDQTVPVEVIALDTDTAFPQRKIEREKENVDIITAYDIDYFVGKML